MLTACQAFGVPVDQGPVAQKLQQFDRTLAVQDWQAVQQLATQRAEVPVSRQIILVNDYHAARERRDLPSGMAMKGVSPNEYVAKQSRILEETLSGLSKLQDQYLWMLLSSLIKQSFDDSLDVTAAEIMYRISPEKFKHAKEWFPDGSEKHRKLSEVEEKWEGQRRDLLHPQH